jgi:hypothetical protein
MIHYRKAQQNTDRTARIPGNTAICGYIVRSVLAAVIARERDFIARNSQIATADSTDKNRPFSGSFSSMRMVAVGAVDVL